MKILENKSEFLECGRKKLSAGVRLCTCDIETEKIHSSCRQWGILILKFSVFIAKADTQQNKWKEFQSLKKPKIASTQSQSVFVSL